ncbi:unnamed protein product, partial [marine sediment metagenome]
MSKGIKKLEEESKLGVLKEIKKAKYTDAKMYVTVDKIIGEGRFKAKHKEKSILDDLSESSKGRNYQTQIVKIINSFTDKINLSEQFIKLLPLYYDDA